MKILVFESLDFLFGMASRLFCFFMRLALRGKKTNVPAERWVFQPCA